jgi:hypothetical protein
MHDTAERNANRPLTSSTSVRWSTPYAVEDPIHAAIESNPAQQLRPPVRKRWSTPRVIVSEVEDSEKLFELIEVTLLPTGPS